LSCEGKVTALSVLLLENDIELRRRLRRKLENGATPTRAVACGLWLGVRDGEENAGTLEAFIFLLRR